MAPKSKTPSVLDVIQPEGSILDLFPQPDRAAQFAQQMYGTAPPPIYPQPASYEDRRAQSELAGTFRQARQEREAQRYDYLNDPSYLSRKYEERLAAGESMDIAIYPQSMKERVAWLMNFARGVSSLPDVFIGAGQALARDIVDWVLKAQDPSMLTGDPAAYGVREVFSLINGGELPESVWDIEDPFIREVLGLDTQKHEPGKGPHATPESITVLGEFAKFPVNVAKNASAIINPLAPPEVRLQAYRELVASGGSDLFFGGLMLTGSGAKLAEMNHALKYFDPARAEVGEWASGQRAYSKTDFNPRVPGEFTKPPQILFDAMAGKFDIEAPDPVQVSMADITRNVDRTAVDLLDDATVRNEVLQWREHRGRPADPKAIANTPLANLREELYAARRQVTIEQRPVVKPGKRMKPGPPPDARQIKREARRRGRLTPEEQRGPAVSQIEEIPPRNIGREPIVTVRRRRPAPEQPAEPAAPKEPTHEEVNTGAVQVPMGYTLEMDSRYPERTRVLGELEEAIKGTEIEAPMAALFMQRMDVQATRWSTFTGEAPDAYFSRFTFQRGKLSETLSPSRDALSATPPQRSPYFSPGTETGLANELRRYEAQHPGARFRYNDANQSIEKVFGADADLFRRIMVATDVGADMATHVQQAYQAYSLIKQGRMNEIPDTMGWPEGSYNTVLWQIVDAAMEDGPNGVYEYGLLEALRGNLQAIHIDPAVMKAFGFKDALPSPEQRSFIQDKVGLMANELGWSPAEVVSAIQHRAGQTEMVGDIIGREPVPLLPGEAGRAGEAPTAIPIETIPGRQADFLPEIHQAPGEVKRKLNEGLNAALRDPEGGYYDLKAVAPGTKFFEESSLGAYEGVTNMNTLVVTPESTPIETVRMAAAARSALFLQDAAVYFRRAARKTPNSVRGYVLSHDGFIWDDAAIKEFMQQVQQVEPKIDGFTVADNGRALVYLNYSDLTPEAAGGILTNAANQFFGKLAGEGRIESGWFEGGYLGQSDIAGALEGRPEIQRALVDVARDRLAGVYEQIGGELGRDGAGVRAEYLDRVHRAIGWEPGTSHLTFEQKQQARARPPITWNYNRRYNKRHAWITNRQDPLQTTTADGSLPQKFVVKPREKEIRPVWPGELHGSAMALTEFSDGKTVRMMYDRASNTGASWPVERKVVGGGFHIADNSFDLQYEVYEQLYRNHPGLKWVFDFEGKDYGDFRRLEEFKASNVDKKRIVKTPYGTYEQKFGDVVKGKVDLLEKDGEFKKAIITLFETADYSTLTHENAHALKRLLPPTYFDIVQKHYAKKGWTRAAEERWARDAEIYEATGKAPTDQLARVFANMKNKLKALWSLQKDEVTPPLDVLDVMEHWYGRPGAPTVMDAARPVQPVEVPAAGVGPAAGTIVRTSTFTSLEPRIDVSKPVSAEDIINHFSKTLGDLPIRFGGSPRFKAGGRLAGFFLTHEDLIRMRTHGDVTNLAHEVAHYLDKYLLRLGNYPRTTTTEPVASAEAFVPKDFMTRRMVAELAVLDYNFPRQTRLYEGFAEFVRYWITNSEMVRAVPEFHRWFENEFLTKNPKIGKALTEGRELITTFLLEGAHNRMNSWIDREPPTLLKDVKERGLKAVVTRGFHKAATLFTNDWHSIWLATRALADNTYIPPHLDPARLAESTVRTSLAKAYSAIFDGPRDSALRKLGPGLKDILTGKAKGPDGQPTGFNPEGTYMIGGREIKAIEALVDYGAARSILERVERGQNFEDFRVRDAHYVVDNPLDPIFPVVAKQVTEWGNHLLEYLREAGGLSRTQLEAIKMANDFWFPLKRVFNDAADLPSGLGAGFEVLGIPVKRAKGSSRAIVDPLESLVHHAQQIISAADRLRVGRGLAELAERRGGGGRWITRVKSPGYVHRTKLENIASQLRAAGADLSRADMDAVLNVYAQTPRFAGKDNTITLYRDGKPVTYEVHPDIYGAFKGIDPLFLPRVFDLLLAAPTRMVRLGATGLRLGFTMFNFFRDALTFAVYSEYTSGNPLKILAAYKDIVKGSEVYEQFRAAGLEFTGIIGMDRRSHRAIIDEMISDTGKAKAMNIVKHPVDMLRLALGKVEVAPRLAEFKGAMEKLTASGMDPRSAAIEAARAASEVTVNFRRMGVYGRTINQIYAFWNAAVQGVLLMPRKFLQHPARTMARAAAWITAPALTLWYAQKDEEWYKNLPTWDKYGFMHFYFGETNEDGTPKVYRLPFPFELGYVFGALPMAVADHVYNEDPKAFENAWEQFKRTFYPPNLLFPTAAKPLVENLAGETGHDFYFDRDIVPFYLADNNYPEMQFFEHTTETAKWAGELFGVSPIKIEHGIAGYTGGLGMDAIRGAEGAARRVGVLPAKPEGTSQAADVTVLGRFSSRIEPEERRQQREEGEIQKEIIRLRNKIADLVEQNKDPEEIERLSQQLFELGGFESPFKQRSRGPRRPKGR